VIPDDSNRASDTSGEDPRGRSWRSEREQYRIIFQRSPVGSSGTTGSPDHGRERPLREDPAVRTDLLVGLDMETLKDRRIHQAVKAPLEDRTAITKAVPGDVQHRRATISMRTTPFFSEDGKLEGGPRNRGGHIGAVKAEEEQSRFAALVEHSNDLIGIASLDGKMLFLNGPAGDSPGWKTWRTSGRSTRTTSLSPSIGPPWMESSRDCVKPGGGKGGQDPPLQDRRVGPSRDARVRDQEPETNEIVAFANISRDISERKAMERR